jgi:ligand-binding sensor domain-containing protein/signal transduction histidine kinase
MIIMLYKKYNSWHQSLHIPQWSHLLLFCLANSFFFAVKAQQPSVKFTHLTNMDGLSQSTVQAMVKDRYGFMWFGTQDGLNRYDGYTFKVYRHQPKDPGSLRRSNIMSLYEDRRGNLWVGTSNGALSLYDRNHDSFIHFKESDGEFKGLSQKSITTIYEDRQNNFWVGTYWKLNLLDRESGKITQFAHDPADPASISGDGITSIFEDNKNNLWIGTSTGLNILDRKTNKFKRYFHDDTNPNTLSDNYVTVISEDDRGRLWIGTGKGLNLFDPVTGTFTSFSHNQDDNTSISDSRITTIEDAGNGKVWIGTGSTLESFDTDKRIFIHFSSNADEPTTLHRNANVMSMLLDKEGILWVGTYQGGINKYDKYLTYFDTYRNNISDQQSLSFNTVTSFAEKPGGDIWISTGGGALNLWKRSTNQFVRYSPEPGNKNSLSTVGLLCLYQSKRNDYLWIGTYGSCIDRYDPKTNIFRHFTKGDAPDQLNNDAVYAIFEDSRGNIWMGTNGGGVNILDPATGIIAKYLTNPDNPNSLSGNYVRCFYEDKKGNIWVGTTSGLNVFDHRTQNFTRYDQSNTKLESDVIFSLYEDGKGNMWAGTLGGGLNLLDPRTKHVTIYTVNDGLPDNTINSILEDDKGNLWLSTNNGISCFDSQKGLFKNSSLHNGIQSFEFSQGAGLKTGKGEILFGGVNGFNSFHPGHQAENRNIPPVVITGFKLFNKTVIVDEENSLLKKDITLTRELTLSYNQSIITFEFAALGFNASEKNQYSFMLEGFDKKWNTGYQRMATYTNLDPGEYIFKVKASNNDGIWNENTASIKITVTPPFWKTWWFRIAVVILIAAILLAFYIEKINRVKHQQKILEQKVKEQTVQLELLNEEEHKARQQADHANEELEKKNKELEQFVYIASHDLREPLRTTSGFVELFQKQYKGKLDEKADTYLSYITQSADRMKMLIDDLLDYSKIGNNKELQQLDCNIILQEVLTDLGVALSEAEAEIRADQLPVISGYHLGIKQLFQNLITNGIKFRKKDTPPKIQIGAETENNSWKFSFADNGIGIDQQHGEKIFVIFQRLHTRKEYEGSGIGLAHCKKIVEQHNGKIWVESTPGKGSTFHFTIHKNNN